MAFDRGQIGHLEPDQRRIGRAQNGTMQLARGLLQQPRDTGRPPGGLEPQGRAHRHAALIDKKQQRHDLRRQQNPDKQQNQLPPQAHEKTPDHVTASTSLDRL